MRKILLSINPEFVEQIIKGNKKFEYRTKIAKKDIKAILDYCTYPTKKVVAKVKIKNILMDTPEKLWEKTKAFSGITEDFYKSYFKDHTIAYAYELGDVIEFKKPRTLKSYGINYAPQSFVYIGI